MAINTCSGHDVKRFLGAPMGKIFVFRHARTTDNQAGIFCGWSNPDLTPDGVKEAESIREKLRHERVTRAYTSDQQRAIHTMEIALRDHSPVVEIVKDPRIRERDYGDLTGKSKKETEKQFPKEYPLWHRSYDVPPPGGESLKVVESRVNSFLDEILPKLRRDDVVLICASANSIRPIRRRLEHMSVQEMCSFEYERGHVYEYQV